MKIIAFEAHAMKGSALTLCAKAVGAQCARLELVANGRCQDPSPTGEDDPHRLVQDIGAKLDQLFAHVAEIERVDSFPLAEAAEKFSDAKELAPRVANLAVDACVAFQAALAGDADASDLCADAGQKSGRSRRGAIIVGGDGDFGCPARQRRAARSRGGRAHGGVARRVPVRGRVVRVGRVAGARRVPAGRRGASPEVLRRSGTSESAGPRRVRDGSTKLRGARARTSRGDRQEARRAGGHRCPSSRWGRRRRGQGQGQAVVDGDVALGGGVWRRAKRQPVRFHPLVRNLGEDNQFAFGMLRGFVDEVDAFCRAIKSRDDGGDDFVCLLPDERASAGRLAETADFLSSQNLGDALASLTRLWVRREDAGRGGDALRRCVERVEDAGFELRSFSEGLARAQMATSGSASHTPRESRRSRIVSRVSRDDDETCGVEATHAQTDPASPKSSPTLKGPSSLEVEARLACGGLYGW